MQWKKQCVQLMHRLPDVGCIPALSLHSLQIWFGCFHLFVFSQFTFTFSLSQFTFTFFLAQITFTFFFVSIHFFFSSQFSCVSLMWDAILLVQWLFSCATNCYECNAIWLMFREDIRVSVSPSLLFLFCFGPVCLSYSSQSVSLSQTCSQHPSPFMDWWVNVLPVCARNM